MSKPASSSTSAIDFANSLDQEGMTNWLRLRLSGCDERFPVDRRVDELPHQLIGSLFKDAHLSEEARERLKLAAIFLLREARQASGAAAWSYDAIEDLFLLLSEVFPPLGPQSRGDTLRSEAGQLLAGWSRELPVRGDGSTRPRLGCLRALRDLGWLETVDFWKGQWDPKYPETALPVLQGLVSFPGMEEEAFKWMAGQKAEHWSEIERLLKTLKPVWMKNPRIQADWDDWYERYLKDSLVNVVTSDLKARDVEAYVFSSRFAALLSLIPNTFPPCILQGTQHGAIHLVFPDFGAAKQALMLLASAQLNANIGFKTLEDLPPALRNRLLSVVGRETFPQWDQFAEVVLSS
jgi:hypothetical protein